MTGPRFRVSSVHGYEVNRVTTGGGGTQKKTPAPTDYLVIDTAVCHRVVAEFPHLHGQNAHIRERRLRAAENLAAQLNAEDEARENDA